MLKVIAIKKGFHKGLKVVGEIFQFSKEEYARLQKLKKTPSWFKPVDGETPAKVVALSSMDEGVTPDQAIEQIQKLKSVGAVEKYVVGDGREQIRDAAAIKIGLLKDAAADKKNKKNKKK